MMHPDLVKLLELQDKDLALIEVDTRLSGVLAEIEVLDGAVRQAASAAEAAQRTAIDAARRRDELEAKIESYRKLQERRRQRLEFVRGAKEAATLMAELDLARSVLAKEEGDWVRSADGVTELEKAAAVAEAQVGEVEASQTEARAKLNARRQAIEAERATALEAREATAAQVEKSLRLRYDKLRTSRSPRAVVALSGAACGSCYTTVPLNRRSQIRAGSRIDWCEACGVILYAPE
jgi:predicted  nucleic acid-binding Zn-ribbon protein